MAATALTRSSTHPPDLSPPRLAGEQVAALCGGVPGAVAGSLGVAAVTFWVLSGYVDRPTLIAWGGLQLVAQAARMLVAATVCRGSRVPALHARALLRGTTCAAGAAWGLLPLLLFPEDGQRQVFLPFVAAGVSGAALAGLGSDRVSAASFLAPTLLPLTGRLFFAGGEVNLAMGALTGLFFVYLLWVSGRSDLAFRQSVATRAWAEEQRRALNLAQSVAKLGSFYWSPPDVESDWSDEHLRLWQVPPGTRPLDFELFLSRIHPDERDALVATFDRALLTGGRYEWNHRILLPDGSERDINGRGEVTLDERGKPAHVVGIVQDITERRRIERELQALNQELEARVAARTEQMRQLERQAARSQRLESLGTLAGGIAHDLNNALTPLAMALDELRDQHAGDPVSLTVVSTGLQRATQMVRHLLNFARGAESGERKPLAVEPLVEEIARLVDSSFPKSIRLETTLEPGLPPVVGDATSIHQVLLNLCVNARDAMPDGGVLAIRATRVSLDTAQAAAIPDGRPGDWVRLDVQDSGTGIPAGVIEQIFEPFFTTKDTDKGTGLGLSTVLGIVRGHGGFLHVTSTPGKGACFAVWLPISTEHVAVDKPGDDARPFRGHGELVLLVDDDATIRLAGRMLLTRMGFLPVLAVDGLDALARLQEYGDEVAAVVTDIQMPNMDGVAFVQEARRSRPGLPIVATSGRLDLESIGVLKSMDVTIFLDKPYREPQLATALQRLMTARV